MVAASVGIGFISMSVWAHHMFTVGLGPAGNIFFVISTMTISVPTGIKIFNWIATMWGGKLIFKTPMLFCTAFLFQFMLAGLTGIMVAAAPFDWQLSGSYFVIAHFHYVLVGAIVFALFGAFYYWYPKIIGRMLNETLGKWHFWLFVIGFHLTFDFMHIPGLLGMPRRIYTYEPGRGWDVWNLIVSIGGDHPGHCYGYLRRQPGLVVLSRQGGWSRSLGCLDAGVVDPLTAAGLQLRRRAGGEQPPSAMGPEAS